LGDRIHISELDYNIYVSGDASFRSLLTPHSAWAYEQQRRFLIFCL